MLDGARNVPEGNRVSADSAYETRGEDGYEMRESQAAGMDSWVLRRAFEKQEGVRTLQSSLTNAHVLQSSLQDAQELPSGYEMRESQAAGYEMRESQRARKDSRDLRRAFEGQEGVRTLQSLVEIRIPVTVSHSYSVVPCTHKKVLWSGKEEESHRSA